MKNVSRSPVTEMLSGKYKILLVVLLAVMLAADLCVCISLWVTGITVSQWIMPLLLMIIDGVYLFTVALSNQRFVYARGFFLVYLFVTLPIVAAWTLTALLPREAVFVGASAWLWIALHFLGIVAAIIEYVYAARRIGGGATAQLVVAIVAAALAVGGVGYYGITLINDGFFGQGAAVRPLVFEFNDDDTCAVVGVLDGRGDEIVVPYEVNGSTVTAVSAQVLTGGIKKVRIACDKDAELFEDADAVSGVPADVELYAERDEAGRLFTVDSLKTKLYAAAQTHWLGNRVKPLGLASDDVYVTFRYSADSFTLADGQVIPTWYGKKGDTLDVAAHCGLDYVSHSDKTSDEDLYWSFNNGGYILSDIDEDGDGINASVDGASVEFERVYKVYVGAGNDEACPAQSLFEFSRVNGSLLDYKLTVERGADRIMDCFDRGEGFTVGYTYESRSTVEPQRFTSLAKVLNDMGRYNNEITVTPQWALDTPKVTIAAETDVVYGDPFSMTASITHPLADKMNVEYEWYVNGLRDQTGDEYSLEHVKFTGTREFRLVAVATAPEITSLTAGGMAEIDVYADSRPVTVNWGELSGTVYDGTPKTASITIDNVIEGDSVRPDVSSVSYTNAGSYSRSVSLTGSDRWNYYIADSSQAQHTYVISPRPTLLDWDEVKTFEYDGSTKYPRATALDVNGNALLLSYNYGNSDAGEHTVVASIRNSNYTVDTENGSAQCVYTITPRVTDVEWVAVNMFEYTGHAQAPVATAEDVYGNSLNVVVTGARTDANMHNGVLDEGGEYIATASFSNHNYTVSDETKEYKFTIIQRSVTLTWRNTALTYNGRPQKPTATALGVDNRPITVNVSGEQTDASNTYGADGVGASSSYTATATLADDNYALNNPQTDFTIAPLYVTVDWSSLSFVYNGRSQMPTARVRGINNADVPVTVRYTDAGTTESVNCLSNYGVTATISDGNYTLDQSSAVNSVSTLFAITRRNVRIMWRDPASYVYNGNNIAPTAYTSDALAGELEIEVVVGLYDGATSGSVNVGSYYARAEITNNDNCIATNNLYDFAITPRAVNVVWSNTEATYNGTAQAPTAEATGVNGKLDVTVAADNAVDAATYIVRATISDGNYTLSNPQTQFVIKPRVISVTVDDLEVEYGTTQYDLGSMITSTVTGELLPDVSLTYGATGLTIADGNIAPGTYEGALGVLLMNNEKGNYTLVVHAGTLTVNAPPEPEPEPEPEPDPTDETQREEEAA